jgi:hypothetical protein
MSFETSLVEPAGTRIWKTTACGRFKENSNYDQIRSANFLPIFVFVTAVIQAVITNWPNDENILKDLHRFLRANKCRKSCSVKALWANVFFHMCGVV